MKFLIFASFVAVATAGHHHVHYDDGLVPYVVNPGGIGGIYKGPDSATIIKGPDGGVIKSKQIGGAVAIEDGPAVLIPHHGHGNGYDHAGVIHAGGASSGAVISEHGLGHHGLGHFVDGGVSTGAIHAGPVSAGSIHVAPSQPGHVHVGGLGPHGHVDGYGSRGHFEVVDSGSIHAGPVSAGSIHAGPVSAGSIHAGPVSAGSIHVAPSKPASIQTHITPGHVHVGGLGFHGHLNGYGSHGHLEVVDSGAIHAGPVSAGSIHVGPSSAGSINVGPSSSGSIHLDGPAPLPSLIHNSPVVFTQGPIIVPDIVATHDPKIVEERVIVGHKVISVPKQLEENTDLVGPSGTISTRGGDAVISGPASITIKGDGVVTDVAKQPDVHLKTIEVKPIVAPVVTKIATPIVTPFVPAIHPVVEGAGTIITHARPIVPLKSYYAPKAPVFDVQPVVTSVDHHGHFAGPLRVGHHGNVHYGSAPLVVNPLPLPLASLHLPHYAPAYVKHPHVY